MSVAKKSYIQRQHYLLAEKARKEANKNGNKRNFLQVRGWQPREND